jgi:hypothetical protein
MYYLTPSPAEFSIMKQFSCLNFIVLVTNKSKQENDYIVGILHISESFRVLEQDKYLHNLFAEAAHFVYMLAGIIFKLIIINRAGF